MDVARSAGASPDVESEMSTPASRASLGPAQEAPRVPILDGIRGIAIILILLHHGNFMQGKTLLDLGLINFTHSTWVGVDLFFVLSGFLITGILIDTRRSGRYFTSFYGRRLVRIFPLYYLSLFVFFYIFQPYFAPDDRDLLNLKHNQGWYWAYLGNIHIALHGTWPRAYYLMHLWSVSVEEQFYVIWPFVVFFLDRKYLKFACVCLLIASPLLRTVLMFSYAGPVPVYVSTATRIDGLVLGALIATMIREPEDIPTLVRNMRYAGLAGLLALLAMVAEYGGIDMVVALDGSTPTLHSKLMLTVVLHAAALLFGWFLVSALGASPRSLFARVLASRFLRVYGKYSYCIYLWHMPIVHTMMFYQFLFPHRFPTLFGSQLPGQIICYAFIFASSLSMGWLSWHLIEKHFLKLKRFFPYGTVIPPESAAERACAAARTADAFPAPLAKS